MADIALSAPAAPRPVAFRTLAARYGFLALLGAAILTLGIAMPNFLDPNNLTLMLRNIGISTLMFLGLTWVIASGKIDVSFMDVAALTTMVCAMAVASGLGWVIGSLAGLATGLMIGAINGLLIGYAGLPPLITTIATGSLARSLAWVIGAGASLPLSGAEGFLHGLLKAGFGVVPLLTVGTLAIYALAWMAQEHLTFGRYLYALERNERALVEAGIPARGLVLRLFVLSALTASLAGLLLTANLNSGQPALGASYFLDGLTAVFLGAIVVKVGKPNVIGTLTGVVFLTVLVSAGAMLGWQNYVREIIKGAVLLAAVVAVLALRARPAAVAR